MRGLFVTGTDTGVGKTVLSAALAAAMTRAGERVCAHKPVLTGLRESNGGWPPDHEVLAAAANMAPEEVAPLRYGPAVSPHLAAELEQERIEPAALLARARAAGEQITLIVEGVGGLLVPFADDFSVRDLARLLGLPVLIAARPGLGTINHALLTLESARAAGLDVRAIVLTPWPGAPTALERSNRATIADVGAIEVATLRRASSHRPPDLASVGQSLPWRRWLGSARDR